MRRIIRSAAPLGYQPSDVRAMIPRDWLLVKRGFDDQSQAGLPGGSAPSKSEIDELVRDYG